MFSHIINIVQPHTLGIERAQAAVLAALQNQQGRDPYIIWSDARITNSPRVITIDLNAHGIAIQATIGIEASQVTCKTNEVQGMLAYVGSCYAEMELKTILKQALTA